VSSGLPARWWESDACEASRGRGARFACPRASHTPQHEREMSECEAERLPATVAEARAHARTHLYLTCTCTNHRMSSTSVYTLLCTVTSATDCAPRTSHLDPSVECCLLSGQVCTRAAQPQATACPRARTCACGHGSWETREPRSFPSEIHCGLRLRRARGRATRRGHENA